MHLLVYLTFAASPKSQHTRNSRFRPPVATQGDQKAVQGQTGQLFRGLRRLIP
jgi:hypothetical protein